jgi:hypothetical protein
MLCKKQPVNKTGQTCLASLKKNPDIDVPEKSISLDIRSFFDDYYRRPRWDLVR